MTAAALAPEVIYAGNGVTVAFAAEFRFLADTLVVDLIDADDLVTRQTSGVDYSVTGGSTDAGGTVTMTTAPAVGEQLRIRRLTARAQTADYGETDSFPAATHEGVLDQLMLIAQEQDTRQDDFEARALLAPDGMAGLAFDPADLSDGDLLEYRDGQIRRFDAAPFSGQFYAGAAGTGLPVPSPGTGADEGLRAALALRTGPLLIGAGAPGILTNLDDILEHVNAAAFFGIATSGSNAAEHVQDVIDELSALAGDGTMDRGAVLRLKPFESYDWEVDPAGIYAEGLMLRPGVTLDLQGARITRRCHGYNERGFVMMSHSALMRGRVDALSEFVSVAGSSLGSQAGVHGPVGIGALYGLGGTVAAPSELEGAGHWTIAELTLTSDKEIEVDGVLYGATLIQGVGGVHSGTIRGIHAPASALVRGVVAFDWGFLGDTDFSASDESRYAEYRTDWEGDLLRTTHPANVRIDHITADDLTREHVGTDVGSFLLRFSGCRAMRASNCRAGVTTHAAVILTAGDPAFEFADAASRTLGMDGTAFNNIEAMSPQRGYLASFDSYGDNLARAIEEHGYSAFTDPLVFAGLTVDGLRGFTDLGADALEGIRCTNLKGAEIFNSAARGFKKNLWLDEGCVNVKARKSSFTFSRESNVYVGHAGTPPVDCELFGNEIHSAGRGGGTHHGILAEDQHRTKIYDNLLGVEGGYDPSTTSNIRVSAGSGLQGWGNKHLSTAAAGIAENILSGNDVDGIDRWDVGEMVDAGFIATAYAGSTILPSYRRTDQDNVKRGRFRVARASLSGDVNPAGGTWTKGDVIGYLECDADGYEGVACTTSGTAGTLALVTGSITSGSTTLTVNDADDLRVGQYITIAGVTGTKKILEIVGVTVTIDSAASATVAAAAVAWSAPVFKQRAKILA